MLEVTEMNEITFSFEQLKANRKALNAGKMKPERVEKFRKLLGMIEQYRRVNQWEHRGEV